MTSTPSKPPTPELKAAVLNALADGSEGFPCRIPADRCRSLLAEARGWGDEQWRAIAVELRISK
jgi:hypothetical protein